MANISRNVLAAVGSLTMGCILVAGCQQEVRGLAVHKDASTRNVDAIPPTYPFDYRMPTAAAVKAKIDLVRDYVDRATTTNLVDSKTGAAVEPAGPSLAVKTAKNAEGPTFPLIAYEQGVTYSAMLYASEVTGDKKYADVVAKRFEVLHDLVPSAEAQLKANLPRNELRRLVQPRSLDDCGAMCASLIRAKRDGVGPDNSATIDVWMHHIRYDQKRLSDGTLARNDPQPDSLWLDDTYMAIPALAEMGKSTGDKRYFDDAAMQILQFADRMFNHDLGLFMHGWSAAMPQHPEFRWARANGWAVVAMTQLLELMPEDHPQREAVLKLYREHVKGLANYQSPEGRWHQLIDRNDSYLETSATAMYVYAMAHGINKGWLSAAAYGPATKLGWNAVARQINARGGVEEVCIGTGMGFDPAFYYNRPKSVDALHGYGPAIFAGAEMIKLIANPKFKVVMGDTQFQTK